MNCWQGKGFKTPWVGKDEGRPLGDTGDEDVPFVIRDADGEIVLEIYEKYGPGLQALHRDLGERLIAAVNSAAELDRMALVIESSVRRGDGKENYRMVMDALKPIKGARNNDRVPA